MRAVMINDCAHVGEDLASYINGNTWAFYVKGKDTWKVDLVKRGRGTLDKTVGVLLRIARLHDYDIYHVHYALQDAYIASMLKRLDVLHCHGSDIRWTLNGKWGFIVRYNLKKAKVVLYATPDMEQKIKEYREDAIYLPTPVRTDIFTPKHRYNSPLRAVYFKLSYEKPPLDLFSMLKERGIKVDVLERNIPYKMMPDVLKLYDIFIDRFTIPSFSKTCLEAMSCGLATIDHRHKDNLAERIKELTPDSVKEEGRRNSEYVMKNHDVRIVADQLVGIWMKVWEVNEEVRILKQML